MSVHNIESTKQLFKENGFAFIPSFLNTEEMEELGIELEEFIRNKVPVMDPRHVFFEKEGNPGSLKQMQNLEDYSEFFQKLIHSSKFQKLAEQVLEDQVTGKNVEYFNKPPLIGKATPPHQDAYYFKITPPEAITMWLALEDVDQENGCIHYIKGSHKKEMRTHGRTQTLGFSQGIVDFGTEEDLQNLVPIPAKKGDLLIHHAMTVHWADPNNSNTRSRRALGLIYFADSAKEDLKAKEEYQKSLAK